MLQVLAGSDFRNLKQPTPTDTLKEQLGAWLNKVFEHASQLRAGSVWVGRLVVVAFILAVCLGLGWGLWQLERLWRLRWMQESALPAASPAAAGDWTRWWQESRTASAAGAWRQAIHALYWAAITRLEARRLWPADRARTPREVLALMAPDDPRKAGLTQLTRSFERTWYGGRPADEADFRRAEGLASALIEGDHGAEQSMGSWG